MPNFRGASVFVDQLHENAVCRYAVPLICENCFRKILENSQSAREGGRGGRREGGGGGEGMIYTPIRTSWYPITNSINPSLTEL